MDDAPETYTSGGRHVLTLDSPEFKNLMGQSAALRGQLRFGEAIDLLERRLPEMVLDCYLNTYMEIIYAAQEGGFAGKALEYATRAARIDPDIPTVKRILGTQ